MGPYQRSAAPPARPTIHRKAANSRGIHYCKTPRRIMNRNRRPNARRHRQLATASSRAHASATAVTLRSCLRSAECIRPSAFQSRSQVEVRDFQAGVANHRLAKPMGQGPAFELVLASLVNRPRGPVRTTASAESTGGGRGRARRSRVPLLRDWRFPARNARCHSEWILGYASMVPRSRRCAPASWR